MSLVNCPLGCPAWISIGSKGASWGRVRAVQGSLDRFCGVVSLPCAHTVPHNLHNSPGTLTFAVSYRRSLAKLSTKFKSGYQANCRKERGEMSLISCSLIYNMLSRTKAIYNFPAQTKQPETFSLVYQSVSPPRDQG